MERYSGGRGGVDGWVIKLAWRKDEKLYYIYIYIFPDLKKDSVKSTSLARYYLKAL